MADFDFRDPDHFTTGTVGPPGQRVFYLQVAEQGHQATFRLEKQQVMALVQSMAELLTDLAEPAEVPPDPTLREPVDAEWTVGAMGVGYDETDDRILVAAQELRPEDPPDADTAFVPDVDDPDPPATARMLLTREQAAAFIRHARQVIESGRPPCPFCGRPLDPGGHACPRMN
jgi:uncharacterized repeat protein (TIGR03847 family)